MVGVDVDQHPAAYQRFLSRHEIDFLTIRDAPQHSNAIFGTFFSRIPTLSTVRARSGVSS